MDGDERRQTLVGLQRYGTSVTNRRRSRKRLEAEVPAYPAARAIEAQRALIHRRLALRPSEYAALGLPGRTRAREHSPGTLAWPVLHEGVVRGVGRYSPLPMRSPT